MADNTQLSAAVGTGDTVRDKDRSGVKTQIVGLDIGVGTGTEKLMTPGQATMANSIPVVLPSDQVANGHGTAAAALRVELPTDGTGVVGLNAGTALVGKVGIDQTTVGTTNAVTPVPCAIGGPSVARIKAASGTNATNVKASAGQVYGWYLFNNSAAVVTLHLYNSASAPTAGSGTPLFTVPVPIGGGCVVEFSMGIPFSSGIGYTITKGSTSPADTDTGSCAADDLHGVLLYK